MKNYPINIRDVLYEGRNEATKTWYRVKEWEEIRYVDVIGLYPTFVNMANSLGHPKVRGYRLYL